MSHPFQDSLNNIEKRLEELTKLVTKKQEKVFDKEVGYKKQIKEQYPFITNDKLSMILEYYTK